MPTKRVRNKLSRTVSRRVRAFKLKQSQASQCRGPGCFLGVLSTYRPRPPSRLGFAEKRDAALDGCPGAFLPSKGHERISSGFDGPGLSGDKAPTSILVLLLQ